MSVQQIINNNNKNFFFQEQNTKTCVFLCVGLTQNDDTGKNYEWEKIERKKNVSLLWRAKGKLKAKL